MAVIHMVNNLKELFPDYVLLLKIGTFYECYCDDANIVSYLFSYKRKTLSSGDKVCGFPLVSYHKVISNLENRNINYISIDKAHNYEEIDKVNYKKKNQYHVILDKANYSINNLERIDKIKNFLLKDNSKIDEIERLCLLLIKC